MKEPVPYHAVVQVSFLVKRGEETDMTVVEKNLWKEMPANNIGDNLFIKFPTQAFDFNVNIKAQRVEDIVIPGSIPVEAEVIVENQ